MTFLLPDDSSIKGTFPIGQTIGYLKNYLVKHLERAVEEQGGDSLMVPTYDDIELYKENGDKPLIDVLSMSDVGISTDTSLRIVYTDEFIQRVTEAVTRGATGESAGQGSDDEGAGGGEDDLVYDDGDMEAEGEAEGDADPEADGQ